MKRKVKTGTKLLRIGLVLLCAFALSISALASAAGSIRIRVEDNDDIPLPGFLLHFSHAADAEGLLLGDFAQAGIAPEDMLNEKLNAKNAAALRDYAAENSIAGQLCLTDGEGCVFFEGLERGIYLVWADESMELSFAPYLIFMPTVINGQENWDIISVPKAGDPDDPENPDDPDDPDDPGTEPTPGPEDPGASPSPDPGTEPTPGPDEPGASPSPGPGGVPEKPSIPQTGVDMLPIYLLFGFGCAFAAAGLLLILRGKGGDGDET